MKVGGSFGTVNLLPPSLERWFVMAPQLLDAGDQSTGSVPISAEFQPSASAVAARPEDTDSGSTRTHPWPSQARLKSSANSFIRSIFSELTAAGTLVQLSSSAACSPPPPPPQAPVRRATAKSATPARVVPWRRWVGKRRVARSWVIKVSR